MKNIEQTSQSENPFAFLKDHYTYINKSRTAEDGTIEKITLLAKILDMTPDGQNYKLEYEGNNNLFFDGTIENLDLDELIVQNLGGVEIPITLEDFTPVPESELGQWRAKANKWDRLKKEN